MIDLYTRPDSDGQKVQIMLEECALGHAVHVLSPGSAHELPARYVAICADRLAPAIVDHESADGRPISVSQAGAILIYLAGKTGRFLPKADRDRFKMLEWLVWGQGLLRGRSRQALEDSPAAVPESDDLSIIDTQLGRTRAFVSGRQYTIADMAIFGDCVGLTGDPERLQPFPHLARWLEAIHSRAAVRRALAAMADGERRARASDQLDLRVRSVASAGI